MSIGLFNLLRRPATRQFAVLSGIGIAGWFLLTPPWSYVPAAAAVLSFILLRLLSWVKRTQIKSNALVGSSAPNRVDPTGVAPPLRPLGLIQNTGWQGALAQKLHLSLPWTAAAELRQRDRMARLQCDFSGWKPTQGTPGTRSAAQLRVVVVAGRGGDGKTLLTGGTAAAVNGRRMEGALVLDVNPIGSLNGRYPVERLPHNKTIHDLAQACLAGTVRTVADFAQYTILTDAGLRVARLPHDGQPELTQEELMAILKASEGIFPMVWMDGGNTISGAMECAVREADVVLLSVNPASANFELPLRDAAGLFRRYPAKQVLAALNQRVPASHEQISNAVAVLTSPPAERYGDSIQETFAQFRPHGLHIRLLNHIPVFADDGPLWLQNMPPKPREQFEEIGATLIDLALGRETPRLPSGMEEKANRQTGSPVPPSPARAAVAVEPPPAPALVVPIIDEREQPQVSAAVVSVTDEPVEQVSIAAPASQPAPAADTPALPPVPESAVVATPEPAGSNGHHPAPAAAVASPVPATPLGLLEIARLQLGPSATSVQLYAYVAGLAKVNGIPETDADKLFDPATLKLPAAS